MENNPRERSERAENHIALRARRNPANLDRSERQQMNPFHEGDLDRANWEYRWFNDKGNRTHEAYNREWDYVEASELKHYDKSLLNSSGGSRVDHVVFRDDGERAVLMRKPKEFYVEDSELVISKRNAQTSGLVKDEVPDHNFTVGQNNSIGVPAPRRRTK